jgi:hypothetical protein
MAEERNKPKTGRAFHTVAHIAERWDCSQKHVRRMIEKGDLVAHRFSNLLRVGDDDLLRCERMNRMD